MSEAITNIATSGPTYITVRGKDLINELVGHYSYTEILYFLITDRFPGNAETKIFDACLVMLMEHGLTPSALVARLVAESVPGQIQVAMSAGLLTVGDVFAGTMEGCAKILEEGVKTTDRTKYCEGVVAAYRKKKLPVPGFGHRLHKPDDPRTPRLLQIAKDMGKSGDYVGVLVALAAAVDKAAGRHITLNATGAIAALLLEIGIPGNIGRAVAVVSRSGGLVGHIMEEHRDGSARLISRAASEALPYQDPQ